MYLQMYLQANALEELRRLIAFMQQSGVPLPPGVAAACAAAVAIPSLQTQFNSNGQVASSESSLCPPASSGATCASGIALGGGGGGGNSTGGLTSSTSPERISSPQSDAPEVDVEVTSSPPVGHTRSSMLLSPSIDSPNSTRRAASGTSFSEKQAKLLVSN